MHMFVPGHSHYEIMEAFNARFTPHITQDNVRNYIRNNGLSTGKTGRFKRGHTPANKGQKMSREQYEKCKSYMFKEGQKAYNSLPIGTEVVCGDGYLWVKIDDKPKVPKRVNWVQKHVLLWEQHNGPVPEGCVVKFLDDDRTNITIENLQLITKAQNARMNQNGFHGPDPEMTKLGIAVADLIIKTAERKKQIEEGK